MQDKEVKYDELEYLPEGIFLLDGKPFTGVAIDRDDRDVKLSEAPFQDGRQHGVSRSWHANGRPSTERPYVDGMSHGIAFKWFDDGSLKSETVFEFGTMMSRVQRDREGKVIESFERAPSDQLYKNVLERRRLHQSHDR